VREQPPGGVREPRCSPAVSDDPWCDADAHDARRPAEYSDGEGEARSSTAGAEWEDDRVRRGGELSGELQSREQMAHHGAGMRSPARNPATRAERPGAMPRVKHRERERGPRPGVHDERRACPAGGGHGAARGCLGLWELRQHGAAARRSRVNGGRETVGRAGAAQGDEDRAGARAREQEFERAYLVPAIARR